MFNQELARYDATSGFITAAQALVGPTLMAHGTREQQQRYLGPLLSGEESWCQLFSEPGAGSDLAALATRAVPDGDEWVVNGQKVWTSSAQHADFGILVARTDPDLPKHEGLTFFIVDMRSPGIEIRPLVQAQGVAHFNEVFLSDVRVPAANIVGEVGAGWKVTRTTLRSESSMISGAGQATGFAAVLNTAQQIGGSIGIAFLNTIAASATAAFVVANNLQQPNADALVEGFTTTFAWSTAILAFAGLVWVVLVRISKKDLSKNDVAAQF